MISLDMIPSSERHGPATAPAADVYLRRDDVHPKAITEPDDERPSAPQRNRLPPSSVPAFAGCVLSPSELQTLRQMARGLSYAEAARETHRSRSTVRSLLHTAYRRLGVSTIAQALTVCWHAGWLDAVPQDGVVVEFADRRVTWAQRLYLEAFDQFLQAGDDLEEVERTRRLREAALEGMYKEAGDAGRFPVADERPWRELTSDPIDRIARDLQRLNLRASA
jgi:DNA-binding CsgD family transcriptional regulator